jgi:hypothetical protein
MTWRDICAAVLAGSLIWTILAALAWFVAWPGTKLQARLGRRRAIIDGGKECRPAMFSEVIWPMAVYPVPAYVIACKFADFVRVAGVPPPGGQFRGWLK